MKEKLSFGTIKHAVLLCALVMFMASGCNEEDERDLRWVSVVFAYSPPENGSASVGDKIFDFQYFLYENQQDYFLDQNRIIPTEQELDATGELCICYKNPEKISYYVRAVKGDLNNLRYGPLFFDVTSNRYQETFDNPNSQSLRVVLTKTPTRLQLNIQDGFEPVEGAEVTLYFTEEDFENDTPAWLNNDELETSYGRWVSDKAGEVLSLNFVKTTDSEGVVLFDNLEPKQYWFKVEKDGQTNASGRIKTDGSLPDDADITTVYTVGIN